MTLEQALATVKAAGYRVSKPKAAKATAPALNAVGKPYSPLFDPNYRMKYRTPPLKRAQTVRYSAVTPERWAEMCATAKAAWDAKVAGEELAA
jgi:hypothetical protein